MTQSDADLFLKKAKEDLIVLEKLCKDFDVSDSSWGFHAQQALEKMIKSVLAHVGVEFARSHDLNYLLELMPVGQVHLFKDIENECDQLIPFAVSERYDDIVDFPLDRAVLLSKLQSLYVKVSAL